VLSFAGERVEVDAAWVNRRGGLRAFAREAEERFGLLGNTFGFADANGKVDSPAALERALEACSEEVCVLEVRERAEARTMRHAAKALEDKMMSRVEKALAEMQKQIEQTDRKVTNSIAPMVSNLANEQIDIREKLDEMNTEAFESRSDVLQSLDDLEKKLEAMNVEALECRIDSITSFEEMEKKLNDVTKGLVPSSQSVVALPEITEAATGALKELEDLCLQASREAALEAASTIHSEASRAKELDELLAQQAENELEALEQSCLESLRAEVRGLQQPRPAADASESSPSVAIASSFQSMVKMVVPAPDALSAPLGKDLFGSVAFSSSKLSLDTAGGVASSTKKAPAGLAPAALGARPRASGRMTSYNSMPLLPPLQA